MHSTSEQLARVRAGREAGASDRVAAIYRSIFDAIVDQRLPPGAKLPEEQLGALFNASRTLVRSALQALSHDNIVTIERHRGAFVAAPSTAEAQDIFHSRRLIEAGIALEVAERIEPSRRRATEPPARGRRGGAAHAATGRRRSGSPATFTWRSPAFAAKAR